MAQYDGSIRIGTRIDVKGIKQGVSEVKGNISRFADSVHNGMSTLDRHITCIGEKVKNMGSRMRKEVSSTRRSVDGLSGSFRKLGVAIASAFAVKRITGIAGSMTELGSDLEEVQNVVDVTFTTMADKVDEFAKSATKSAGLSETMAKRYAGTFGAMSKSFGFAEDAALGMSLALTQLAGDVALFYNISQDEAYTKLKSVFTGETETLKELGVVMTENALNSYAMAKGISKTVSKMTEQEKVALRYQFVMEKLSGASGDFIRTQDSWANQTRILKLQIESLKATIGQGLINVLTPLLKMLNTLLEKLKAVTNAFKSFTESFFGKSQAGGSGAGNKYVDTAEGITGSLEDVADAAEDAEKALEGYLSPLDEINKYDTGKDGDLLSELEDIDFGQLGDLNMGVTITPKLDDSALSKKLSNLAEKVKSVLERLFRPLKEAWDREGKSVMDSWKRALDEVWKLVKDIGWDFLDVWNQEKTIAVLQNVLHIVSNIGLTVEKLAHNFREAWNENDRGKRILENIRDITGKIVANISLASDKTVEWADKLDFAPLLESFEKYTKSLIPVADTLSGILYDFYTKVLLPLGTWTLEKGLPELLDVLTKFNEKVDWESLRKNLAEFWDHLEPFAETVGEGLIIFIERVSDALANFLNSQEFKDFLVMVENWMDSVTPEDVADALELVAKSLIALKLALLGYSAIKGVVGIFATIKSFLAIFGIGGSAATAASTMDTVASSARGLSVALSGLAAVAAVVGSYKLLTGHMEEIAASFGRSTDQARRLEDRYNGLEGAATFAKDGIDMLKNGIEGYGFAADNCVGSGVALEKAMEDIGNGAILTDQHMAELQKRFSLTDEDMEMLRQEMLDTNPLLREIADNLGFEDASPETLQDIAEGFALIANGVEPLPEDLSSMTDEARNFITSVMESENPMEVYGDKLANLGTIAENTSASLNETGRSISDGITKGMEDADVETASQGLFSRIITKVKNLFGIHSPSTVMAEIGTFMIQALLNGINSLVENVTAVWQSMKETAAEIWEKVKTTLSGTWENIKTTAATVWNTITTTLKGIWERIKTTVATVFDGIKAKLQGVWDGIKSTVERVWNNISTKITGVIDTVKQKIEGFVEKINSAIRAVKDFLSSGYEKIKGAFSGGDSGSAYSAQSYSMRSIASPYAANPAFAALSAAPIPKLATGAVIPANREFLAVLGDQKHGTNIEAPLDTIMQANEQLLTKAMMQLGTMGGSMTGTPQTVKVQVVLDRKVIGESTVDWGKIRQMSTGSNLFLLGNT